MLNRIRHGRMSTPPRAARRHGRWAPLMLIAALAATAFAQAPDGAEPIPAEQLLPLEPSRKAFKVIEGENTGEVVTLSLQKDGAGDTWVLDLEGFNRAYLQRNGEGQIMLTRLDIEKENYSIRYDEPVTMLPATVDPDQVISTTTQAKVYNLKTGELDYTGKCTHRVDTVTRAVFHTPAGDINGYRIAVHQHVDLDNAELSIDLQLGCAKGRGFVYRRVTYTIDKLAVFGSTSTRAVALAKREREAERGERRVVRDAVGGKPGHSDAPDRLRDDAPDRPRDGAMESDRCEGRRGSQRRGGGG